MAGRGLLVPKGNAATNYEFTDKPICLASRQYQKTKIEEINEQEISEDERKRLIDKVQEKSCICDHLGNGILIKLGIEDEKEAPQAICPGPNIVWFNRTYTLQEMVDHIYGRRPSLVPADRPHMFASEIIMNVDYFEKLFREKNGDPLADDSLSEYKTNLEHGMAVSLEIAQADPYPDENLSSIPLS